MNSSTSFKALTPTAPAAQKVVHFRLLYVLVQLGLFCNYLLLFQSFDGLDDGIVLLKTQSLKNLRDIGDKSTAEIVAEVAAAAPSTRFSRKTASNGSRGRSSARSSTPPSTTCRPPSGAPCWSSYTASMGFSRSSCLWTRFVSAERRRTWIGSRRSRNYSPDPASITSSSLGPSWMAGRRTTCRC